jgi:hypothetical protein
MERQLLKRCCQYKPKLRLGFCLRPTLVKCLKYNSWYPSPNTVGNSIRNALLKPYAVSILSSPSLYFADSLGNIIHTSGIRLFKSWNVREAMVLPVKLSDSTSLAMLHHCHTCLLNWSCAWEDDARLPCQQSRLGMYDKIQSYIRLEHVTIYWQPTN